VSTSDGGFSPNLGSTSFGSSVQWTMPVLVVTAEYWAASVRGVLDEDDFCGSFGVLDFCCMGGGSGVGLGIGGLGVGPGFGGCGLGSGLGGLGAGPSWWSSSSSSS
jgi:hypothetical protein